MHPRRFALAALAGLALSATAVETPKPKPKPQFQYQTDGIEVSIPTADEPKVKTFNTETIRAAATKFSTEVGSGSNLGAGESSVVDCDCG